jgi:predicted DCC family thiol-disulfide oxidoreductase YuxK
MARWVRRRDSAGRVLVMPNQARGVLARCDITRAEADRSAWAIDRAGRRWEGAAACNRVLKELGGVARPLARVLEAGPVEPLEAAAYRWFARNRARFGRFGVRPECDDPEAGCV